MSFRPHDLVRSVNRWTLRLALCLLAISFAGCGSDSTAPKISDSDLAANNRGVALMGRFDYTGAYNVFAELVDSHPDWHAARTNLAISLMNRQQPEDSDLALQQLEIVLAEQPDDVRAHYVAGLLRLYLGEVEPAARHFAAVLAIDDNDAYAHYYLGQCHLRLGDEEAALAAYQDAMQLDPYLRSAYYSAAQVLQRLGRNDEARAQLAIFERFENNPSARLAEFKYTRMGPKSLAFVIGEEPRPEDQPAAPAGPLFAEARVVAQLEADAVNALLTTSDINQDGLQDLFVAGIAQGGNRALLSTAGQDLAPQDNYRWSDVAGVNAVAWGDIDNNGHVDVYLCRKGANQLWMQEAAGDWRLAGTEANVADGEKDCADVAMVDADHDGDLDLLIANRGAGDSLLNNNRDGSFRSLQAQLGAAAEVRDTQRVIVTDLDGDLDVDLLFMHARPPHSVLINDRLWNYTAATGLDGLRNSALRAVTAADLDADGQVELFAADESGQITAWQRAGESWQPGTVYASDLAAAGPVDLAALDLRGDGRAELVLFADGAFEVLAVGRDFTGSQLLLQRYAGGKAIPVLRSATQGSSFVAIAGEPGRSSVMEWQPGPGRFAFATMTLSGKHDDAQTMRSNRSGIGTQISVRNGSQWSVTDTHKSNSLRGHSWQPVAVGLNGRSQADFVAVEWSDGVYQTELDVQSGPVLEIGEIQRQLGSCPVLFAWDGERFAFVTDLLGVAAQGFLVEPGVLLPPRPWERTAFAPGSLATRDGRLMFKLTEPMEENAYVDAMLLETYDLPPEWQIVVDERLGTAPPEVTGKTLFYRTVVEPASAYDRAGNDVRAAIAAHDQQAMPPGEIDRRFIGLLSDMQTLTLEFERPIDGLQDQPQAYPVLVAESWVELPYSQTHFSAWQAGRQFRSVTLEARDADGEWHTIYPDFGIPGGMPRVMSLPMADLPAGTRALRLSWNREIYWDRVRVVFAEPPPESMQQATHAPHLARVAKTGFSKRETFAQRRPHYDYQRRTPFRDTRYAKGFYTNLGEATELVQAADDALAIIGPGEEVHVEFDASESPPAGMQRWYVLDTRGWGKDKDLYTYQGNTVGPLPRAYPDVDSAKREELHKRYNTRFQAGR